MALGTHVNHQHLQYCVDVVKASVSPVWVKSIYTHEKMLQHPQEYAAVQDEVHVVIELQP